MADIKYYLEQEEQEEVTSLRKELEEMDMQAKEKLKGFLEGIRFASN